MLAFSRVAHAHRNHSITKKEKMYPSYLYALVPFCMIIGLVFVGALPIVDALAQRTGYRQVMLVERICLALALVVVLLALAGLVVSISPWEYRAVIARGAVVALVICGAFFYFRRRKEQFFFSDIDRSNYLYLGTFVLFSIVCIALALGKYALPANLPDGAYVNKEHVTAVRIQRYTGNLPADNVVPYVASEYLLRGLSFKDNHPMLPGQAVTNRPLLLSLVIVTVRASLSMPPQMSDRLPTFSYVGAEWPDFRIFVRDKLGFTIFLAVAITLNAALILAAGAIAIRTFRLSFQSSIIFCALFVSSPYFIFQTLFTWPKALAAFFIISAFLALFTYRFFIMGGILLGLAYLSHPYAIAYMAVFLLFVAFTRSESLKSFNIKVMLQVFLSMVLVLVPWFLWTRFVDLESDLVSQNFFILGQTLADFLWVRVVNIATIIHAPHLMQYPFNLERYISQSSVNAIGALGLIPSFFLIATITRIGENRDAYIAICTAALSVALLTLVFSSPAVPALHGYQAFLPLALLLALKNMEQYSLVIRSLLYIQIIVNFAVVIAYTIQLRA